MISNMPLQNRLLSIYDYSFQDITSIFSIAEKQNFKIKDNGVFISIFFENSTRTLLSFEKSAINCGLSVMRFDANISSIKKEETEINTIRTLNELKPKVVAIRAGKSGEVEIYSKYLSNNVVVLNAGDGTNEHPTQSLLDAFTILEAFKIKFKENCFKGLKIAIMGDIMHSRVARSNIFLLSKLGAKIDLICPPNFLLPNFAQFYEKEFGVKILQSFEGADFLILLRLQKERIEGSGKIHYPPFQFSTESDLKGALLMHPGPINTEVSNELAYNSKQSLISKQVSNGSLVRSAILKHFCS
jgi:aspartate carbamoyltransferase catalytic subunit